MTDYFEMAKGLARRQVQDIDWGPPDGERNRTQIDMADMQPDAIHDAATVDLLDARPCWFPGKQVE